MRKLFILIFAVAISFSAAFAQDEYKFTEASDLTIIGKLMTTPHPYHRVDTVVYKGFTEGENRQVRMTSGLGVVFKTNSEKIVVRTSYGYKQYSNNTNGFSARGYDMYIKQDGEWRWAASCCPTLNKEEMEIVLLADYLGTEMKECLVYFPTYAEEYSIQLGINPNAVIEPIESPFRHRVAVFGSSFTHGSSTSRAGMTWPAQFTRHTGIQLLSLGCSGNSKLQPYFADVLADGEDIDAFLFDAFSNPSPAQIEERLFPFIETIQAKHPGKPLIFQRTIYRELRRFNSNSEATQTARINMADSLMKIAVKKYPDVYYIHPKATNKHHEATVDGTHPDNYGYTLWSKSIERKVKRILRKYGLK